MNALEAFKERMKGLRLPRSTTPPWRTLALMQAQGARCEYCGVAVTLDGPWGAQRAVVDYLVPECHGGSPLPGNVVLACASCQKAKGDRDWLDWQRGQDPDALMARRLHALGSAWNHLPRTTVGFKTKGPIERMLAKRWAFPRATVAACCTTEGGLVGMLGPVPPHVYLIVRQHQAANHGAGVWCVEREAFLKCAWALVESNAWVKRLTLGAWPDGTPGEDPEGALWWAVVRNINDLVRRRMMFPAQHGDSRQ
ncbi:HNH endonuclease [Bacillus sp. NP157]|nr:HNH endonuclease [Bacillus sp. NP157]